MARWSRALILVASLALGLLYVLPVWTIKLEAPQYPEGLGMVIRINTIEGQKQHDLSNINNLNHYIGMQRIVPDSIPELKIMPIIVAVLIVTGLLVALLGHRRLLYAWTVGFLAISVVGLADFWKWEYDYGHNLDDENAIMKIPGMSYQPPLIGSRDILNFTAHSWPGAGGLIAILAAMGAVAVSAAEWRRRDGDGEPGSRSGGGDAPLRPVTTAIVAALLLSACGEPEPRPLIAGVDDCADCLMVLDAGGHGAELVTTTGKVYTFDSAECMINHLRSDVRGGDVHSVWVTDFAAPGELVRADEAFYLVSPTLGSPMGLGITAFRRVVDRDGAVHAFDGRAASWRDVQALVASAWPDGRPAMKHGGHTAELTPDGQLSRTVQVGPEAPFQTISEAVAAARAGDTVQVAAGTYREPTLVIDRPLVLLGAPGTILDGEGERGLVEIRADSVTVAGLTLRDTGLSFTTDRAAILVDGARYCEVRDNRLESTFFGIYLANSGDCRITDNTLVASGHRETRSGNGIHLWYSTRIAISGNRIEGHRDGIYFEFVEDSEVSDNESIGNVRYGLHFMFSDGCDYRRNAFSENGAGVAVMYTRDIVMEDNDFRGNLGSAAFGLLLKDITDSEIVGNRFRRNSVAVHAEGANRVELRGNDFVENGWAMKIMANSESSMVTGNNFVGNSFDVATNSRRSYSDFHGNYWDRYRGYDRDGDGVGDVPFHPVRLFSLVVAQNEPALVLQRSPLVALLDVAEQVLPVLTPENLVDERPSLAPFPTRWGT